MQIFCHIRPVSWRRDKARRLVYLRWQKWPTFFELAFHAFVLHYDYLWASLCLVIHFAFLALNAKYGNYGRPIFVTVYELRTTGFSFEPFCRAEDILIIARRVCKCICSAYHYRQVASATQNRGALISRIWPGFNSHGLSASKAKHSIWSRFKRVPTAGLNPWNFQPSKRIIISIITRSSHFFHIQGITMISVLRLRVWLTATSSLNGNARTPA